MDPTRLRLLFDAVDPLQHFDAALDLASLGGLIPEALDEALDLGNALRLIARLRGQELAPRLTLDQVIVVVTRIQRNAARPEVGDRRDHPVQEVAIVRHDHHGALVRGEERLQPGQRLEIQMVRRLVEEQERGPQQEQAREGSAHPPTTRELGERAGQVGRREAETTEDRASLRFEPVPAEGFEAMLELAVLLGQSLGRRRRQGGGHLLHLALESPDLVEAAQRFTEH